MDFDPLAKIIPIWPRILLGIFVLSIMAVSDWKTNGSSATRYKEYLFLVVSAFVAIVFAEVHDAITVRISPAYFAEGKGLGWTNLFTSVAELAVRASYWMGLALGLLYLIANNPFKDFPRLSYRELYKLMLLPIVMAVLLAPVFGIWFRLSYKELEPSLAFVWGVHNGTYLGAFLGALIGIGTILRRRLVMRRSE